MKKVQVELNATQMKVLESLIPGFGNDVDEVARFIVINWLGQHIGFDGIKARKP
jgi:hypothetical protein